MPRYLATLKNGDQILTDAATVSEARAHIRGLYHVRQWAFPIAPDTLAAAREQIREFFDEGALLMDRYRRLIHEAEYQSIEEERQRFLSRLDRLGEPDEEVS